MGQVQGEVKVIEEILNYLAISSYPSFQRKLDSK